ncbi:MAG: hypothetical protein ABIP49_10220 [Lysobacterales bacterium]
MIDLTTQAGVSTALLLALGVALGVTRGFLRWRPSVSRTSGRSAAAAAALLTCSLVLHGAVATLLWLTLFPPTIRIAAETLVVLTARAQPWAERESRGRVVALPEAAARAGVERFADLGTALRRYPDTRRVRVIGEGLNARDRDAARDVVVEFVPATLPVGLLQIDAPAQVAQGARFRVHGHVAGVENPVAQLRDPAGAIVSSAKPDRNGRFTLMVVARAAGKVDYQLRLLNRDRPVHADTRVPLQVVRGDRMRIDVLAGAPGPELKYFRRWATDAGLDVRSEIALGAGNKLRSTAASIERSRFADADLVVLDERALRALGEAGQTALLQAVRDGTGVLLRFTSALTPAERTVLRRWGFAADSTAAAGTSLAQSQTQTQRARRARQMPVSSPANLAPLELPLHTRSHGIVALDGIELRNQLDDAVLGLYRVEGRGRIGVWFVVDSYRMVLADRATEHGALWSRAVAEMARSATRPGAPQGITASMRVGERQTLCGIETKAAVIAPDGRVSALFSTQAPVGAALRNCAGFWPRLQGWHALRMGTQSWPFHVRSAHEAPGLRAFATHQATLRLASLPEPFVKPVTAFRRRERWPWFLAWLAASSLLWFLERLSAGTVWQVSRAAA